MLDNLYLGLEKIADFSYEGFLESFGLNKESFADATRFEAFIAAFFYIDYCLSCEIATETVRKDFYEVFIKRTGEEFGGKLLNRDLTALIEYRYGEYSQIPMKIGKDWLQSFHNLYEVKLKGTKDKKEVEKLPPIQAEDIFSHVPKKLSFIKEETGSIYRATKLVKKLLAGEDLPAIFKEMEEDNLRVKKSFKEKGL